MALRPPISSTLRGIICPPPLNDRNHFNVETHHFSCLVKCQCQIRPCVVSWKVSGPNWLNLSSNILASLHPCTPLLPITKQLHDLDTLKQNVSSLEKHFPIQLVMDQIDQFDERVKVHHCRLAPWALSNLHQPPHKHNEALWGMDWV